MTFHVFSNLVDEDCIRCEMCYVNVLSAKSSFCEDGSKYPSNREAFLKAFPNAKFINA